MHVVALWEETEAPEENQHKQTKHSLWLQKIHLGNAKTDTTQESIKENI